MPNPYGPAPPSNLSFGQSFATAQGAAPQYGAGAACNGAAADPTPLPSFFPQPDFGAAALAGAAGSGSMSGAQQAHGDWPPPTTGNPLMGSQRQYGLPGGSRSYTPPPTNLLGPPPDLFGMAGLRPPQSIPAPSLSTGVGPSLFDRPHSMGAPYTSSLPSNPYTDRPFSVGGTYTQGQQGSYATAGGALGSGSGGGLSSLRTHSTSNPQQAYMPNSSMSSSAPYTSFASAATAYPATSSYTPGTGYTTSSTYTPATGCPAASGYLSSTGYGATSGYGANTGCASTARYDSAAGYGFPSTAGYSASSASGLGGLTSLSATARGFGAQQQGPFVFR